MNRSLPTLIVSFLLVTNVFAKSFVVRPLGTSTEKGRHYITMQVWNCTNGDVEVALADLPWGQDRLGLVLYPAGRLPGEPLKERIPIADFPDTKIKIAAKRYVEGRVDLDSRFFGIARYEVNRNIIVFWAYDLGLITGGKSQIVGGMIPLGVANHSKNLTGMPCN